MTTETERAALIVYLRKQAAEIAAAGQQGAGDTRAQFEAWAAGRGWNLSPRQNNCGILVEGEYGHPSVQRCWEAWQAALAARQTGAQVPVASIDPRYLWLMAGKDGTLSGNVLRFGASMQPGDAPLYTAPPAQPVDLLPVVMLAYGLLWMTSDDPATSTLGTLPPHVSVSRARILLRDAITHEQCGEGITSARALIDQQAGKGVPDA